MKKVNSPDNKLKLKHKHPLKMKKHRQTSKSHKMLGLNLRKVIKMIMFQNLNLKKLHLQIANKLMLKISLRSKHPIIKMTRSLLMVKKPVLCAILTIQLTTQRLAKIGTVFIQTYVHSTTRSNHLLISIG